MRFDAIKIQHLGPFTDVDLDFSRSDARLIAVAGDNGAGKSTLLELLPAALHRQCPTRGSLVDLATARDARLEVRVQNGSPTTYTLVQHVDAVSRKGEAQVLSDKGESLVDSAKVRDVDEWVRARFPSPDVLFASAFLAQGSQGFLQLAPAERKRVLLRLLQIERLETLAERARGHERHARTLMVTAQARVQDVLTQYPDLDTAQAQAQAAAAAVETAKQAVARAGQVLREAQEMERATAAARGVEAQRSSLRERRTELAREVADVQERIANNQKLMARAADIQRAVSQADDLQTRAAELQTAWTEAHAKHARLEAQHEAAWAAHERARMSASATEARLAELRENVKKAQGSFALVAKLPALKKKLADANSDVRAVEQQIADLETAHGQALVHRVDGLRGGLTQIAEGSAKKNAALAATRIATGALAADDKLAAAARSAPEQLRELRSQLAAQRRAAERAAEAVQRATDQKAQAQALTAVRDEAARVERELARLNADTEAAGTKAVTLGTDLKVAKAAVQRITGERNTLQTELSQLQPTLNLAPKLAQSEERLRELEPRLVRLGAEHQAVTEQLDALPAAPDQPEGMLDVAQAEQQLAEVQEAQDRATACALRATDEVERARKGQALLAERRAELQAAETRARDYGRLGRDLGKDGVQAMEIDAALPELQALANDLLHTCHGSRFTLQLSTTALSSDGKRTLEALDVRVIDTEHGRDDLVETFSGGERVILGEALSLALTMLACRAAGLERPTLVRDESGAALDPENGRAYVAMLRRAAELLRADKVFYVSHTPELQALADATITVANGHATLHA